MKHNDRKFLHLQKYIDEVFSNSHSSKHVVDRCILIMDAQREDWHKIFEKNCTLEERVDSFARLTEEACRQKDAARREFHAELMELKQELWGYCEPNPLILEDAGDAYRQAAAAVITLSQKYTPTEPEGEDE